MILDALTGSVTTEIVSPTLGVFVERLTALRGLEEAGISVVATTPVVATSVVVAGVVAVVVAAVVAA